jgi:hypothetical protein
MPSLTLGFTLTLCQHILNLTTSLFQIYDTVTARAVAVILRTAPYPSVLRREAELHIDAFAK